ncbi:MFS transporter [Candidatus Woesearchaeota archaeon]|nr:MFS transporter [Candidatus Woesearchaeota archaeon]
MKNQTVLLGYSALWAAFDGLTSMYLVAFALELGASNIVVGLLGALPFLASMLTQIPGAQLIEHHSRKGIAVLFGCLNRLLWLPLLAAPFLVKDPLTAIVVFFLLAKFAETTIDPSVTSLLADVVPPEKRGKFFSKRLTLIGLFGMAAMLAGGFLLKQIPGTKGFAILFGSGAVLGLVGTSLLRKVQEPHYKDHEHHHIKEFFTLTGPLRRMVSFGVMFNFAYMLASPFFAVYILKNLGVSYWYYGIVTSIATAAQIASVGYMGKLTDTFGDKPVAILGHLGTALVPLVYLFITKETIWLLVPAQILSGVVWAAADLSRFNLYLDFSDPKRRAMQIAEINLYSSIPLVIGPLIGGYLSENVVFIMAGIPLVFLLSGVLRMLSALMLIGIPEPRSKHEYSAAYVFREVMQFHPNRGVVFGVQVVRRIAAGLGLR